MENVQGRIGLKRKARAAVRKPYLVYSARSCCLKRMNRNEPMFATELWPDVPLLESDLV